VYCPPCDTSASMGSPRQWTASRADYGAVVPPPPTVGVADWARAGRTPIDWYRDIGFFDTWTPLSDGGGDISEHYLRLLIAALRLRRRHMRCLLFRRWWFSAEWRRSLEMVSAVAAQGGRACCETLCYGPERISSQQGLLHRLPLAMPANGTGPRHVVSLMVSTRTLQWEGGKSASFPYSFRDRC
jgi:hypothetical protein